MRNIKRGVVAVLRSVIVWLLYLVRFIFGKAVIKMNFRVLSQLASTAHVLRALGAKVGSNTHIYSDICVYNLDDGSCRNLAIGSNVYIGPRCLFDLTSRVEIESDSSISAQVSFITHLDVGNQPLKQIAPRREGAILVKRGAWIGVNTSILNGVTIGEFAMVGAMSLVNKDVPPKSLAYGVPCRPIRDYGMSI